MEHDSPYLYGMKPVHLAGRFIWHRITSTSGKSEDPFIGHFKDNILKDCKQESRHNEIEQLRKELLRNPSQTGSTDPGAGSHAKRPQRSVAEFTRLASVSPGYGRLLHRLAREYQPPVILELGTAVGLGTLYLATGYPKAKVFTIEGNRRIADIAQENFDRFGLGNITLIRGEFDQVLPQLVGALPTGSMIYIDGNHTGEALQRYFSMLVTASGASCFVFDDINWSESMYRGWKAIRNSGNKGLWIDLFRMGMYLGNYRGTSRFMRFSY